MAKKTFAVIGMGRFGESVVEELMKLENDVLVLDKSQEKIDRMINYSSHAICLDSTDKIALKEIGIQSISTVVVAIGKDIESSILTTLILKELGVENVTVKVQNEYHAKVVKRIGADHLVYPEQETGKRLAKKIASKNILEYYDLGDKHDFIVIETTSKVYGTSIINLDSRQRFGINIVAIKREGKLIIPTAQDIIEEKDHLLLVGKNCDVDKFVSWLRK